MKTINASETCWFSQARQLVWWWEEKIVPRAMSTILKVQTVNIASEWRHLLLVSILSTSMRHSCVLKAWELPPHLGATCAVCQRQMSLVRGPIKSQGYLKIPVIKVQPQPQVFPNMSCFYWVPILYVPGSKMTNSNLLCVPLRNPQCDGEMAT